MFGKGLFGLYNFQSMNPIHDVSIHRWFPRSRFSLPGADCVAPGRKFSWLCRWIRVFAECVAKCPSINRPDYHRCHHLPGAIFTILAWILLSKILSEAAPITSRLLCSQFSLPGADCVAPGWKFSWLCHWVRVFADCVAKCPSVKWTCSPVFPLFGSLFTHAQIVPMTLEFLDWLGAYISLFFVYPEATYIWLIYITAHTGIGLEEVPPLLPDLGSSRQSPCDSWLIWPASPQAAPISIMCRDLPPKNGSEASPAG